MLSETSTRGGAAIKPDYSIRVLTRAAEILGCFTITEPEKTLSELAAMTALNKSTVFRIMETLEDLSWVRKIPDTGCYRMGFGIFELGSRAVNGIDFYRASRPHLENLVKVTRQAAHLVIHNSGETLYLNKLENPDLFIAQPSSIGMRLPMHCTAVGKVLLAWMDEEKARAIVKEKGLRRATAHTITDEKVLFENISKIREQGYAVDNEEIQAGLKCVAAPVYDHTGKVIAAISVSGLKEYFKQQRIYLKIQSVVQAAQAISADLGYRGTAKQSAATGGDKACG